VKGNCTTIHLFDSRGDSAAGPNAGSPGSPGSGILCYECECHTVLKQETSGPDGKIPPTPSVNCKSADQKCVIETGNKTKPFTKRGCGPVNSNKCDKQDIFSNQESKCSCETEKCNDMVVEDYKYSRPPHPKETSTKDPDNFDRSPGLLDVSQFLFFALIFKHIVSI
jgi:hypothetical protein